MADLALLRADRALSAEFQSVVLPYLHHRGHEVVHHGLGVVGGGSHAETLHAPGDGRVVDGLDVDVMFIHELGGHMSTKSSISYL